jgi:COP9 signalosome complex subunit 6
LPDKDVHKAPALEFVGWFTLCPPEGPIPEFVPLQRQAINFYNDNAILLALHPEAIVSGTSTGGKLPITVYESVNDVEKTQDEGSMQVDGEDTADIRFRQLPYTIDTDETEMIAIDYVAKGAGSAAAVDESVPEKSKEAASDQKGKKRATPALEAAEGETNDVEDQQTLTAEEEDQIAGMTTRLNSVKMLQTRLNLLRTFIESLPPSYLSTTATDSTFVAPKATHLPHLRNIQSLLTRLSLLTPATPTSSPTQPPTSSKTQQAIQSVALAQSNDVNLTLLLSNLSQDIQSLSELGRKYHTVETHKSASRSKNQHQGSQNLGGGMGGTKGMMDDRFGGGVGGMGKGGMFGATEMGAGKGTTSA